MDFSVNLNDKNMNTQKLQQLFNSTKAELKDGKSELDTIFILLRFLNDVEELLEEQGPNFNNFLDPCECKQSYSIEEHGSGWALYLGRCAHKHGLNLANITEPDMRLLTRMLERLNYSLENEATKRVVLPKTTSQPFRWVHHNEIPEQKP